MLCFLVMGIFSITFACKIIESLINEMVTGGEETIES